MCPLQQDFSIREQIQAAVMEPEFIDAIFAVIKTKLGLVQASEQWLMAARQSKTAKREAERSECEKQLKKLKLSQTALLEQMLEGKLTKEKYQAQKTQVTTEIKESADRLASLENQTDNDSDFVEAHKPFFGQDAPTRELLQELIKEIRVTSADEIDIVWRYEDCYNDTQGLR